MTIWFRTMSYQLKFLVPNSGVNATQLGQAMINDLFVSNEKEIFTPKDILELTDQ